MRVLLVHARVPITYWGFQYGLPLAGRKASLPPLGLITVAAHLPADWPLRLVDLNIGPLADEDLEWADVVMVGGMRVQAQSIHEVLAAARAAGRPTVVGGPAATVSPEEYADADLVFAGELEGRAASLVEALEQWERGPRVLTGGGAPDLADQPVPRFDLLDLRAYTSMSLQYSRGCPYSCEFCDVVELFGRRPRVKPPAQVLAELDALHRAGYRGSLFFVDDNFIGNARAVKELLPHLRRWQEDHGRPFELYTEASVNLAADPELVRGLVTCGFRTVFVGIETPSVASLRAAGKLQNLRVDLTQAVDTLTRAGLEVMAGFIIGFDTDGPEAFEAQRAFLDGAPIPLAMLGLLTALPGTALWRRLGKEGRLRSVADGDQFARPNFAPAMDEGALLDGYAALLAEIWSPKAYLARCTAYLDRAPLPADFGGDGARHGLATLARCVLRLGVLGRRRLPFWRLLWRAFRRSPRLVRWAIAHAIQGEHLIRYTEEDVLPRLAAAGYSVSKKAIRSSMPAASSCDVAPCVSTTP